MKRAAGQLGILSTMAFAIALYVSCAECGRSASAPETISSEHPYLFVDGSTFKNLSENDEPTVVMLREHILATADSALEKGVIPVPKSGPNMGYMRAVQGQVLHLSAAYRMSGKREYFDAVRRQVDLLDTLSDWGTGHFLDIGEAALAVGIAYDWLYDEWTPEDRSEMEEAIVGCAFAPSYEVGEEEGSWMRGDFNWTQVCHGGLAVAALAIYNSCPEEARAIVERAAECVPNAAQVYYPDGAYPEGASYWEYGTTFQILLIEAMRTSIGHSFGLDEYEGFMESADFRVQLVGNTGQEYAFSDSHGGSSNEPAIMWYARELERKDLQENELGKIREILEKGGRTSRLTVFDLLWWKDIEDVEDTMGGNIRCSQHDGKMPIAFMRTDQEHNHAYVGFKGGTPYHSHGHQDGGSFIYESQGVRWATDLGSESYGKMREAKLDLWNYAQNSSRWTTFRTSAESHNLLRVDGDPLVTVGCASEMSFSEGEDFAEARLDVTPLYDPGKVESIIRSVRMDGNGNLVVSDSVRTRKAVSLSSQWLTDAEVEVIADGVRLDKDGKRIMVVSYEADEVTVTDVSSVPGVQNSPNPGFKCVSFTKMVDGSSDATLSLKVLNIG